MKKDYLWDKSGEPDPEVHHLEEILGALGHEGKLDLEALPEQIDTSGRWWPVAAVAAAALLLVGLWALNQAPVEPSLKPIVVAPEPDPVGWAIAVVEGAPTVGGAPLPSNARLEVGQWLETDAASRARVEVAEIGTLDVGADTRLRLKATGAQGHRVEMSRGAIHATVNAPPRIFFVETPSATAVDLGCEYTLNVRDDGTGLLSVITGHVALEGPDRVSLVPAGASCRVRPTTGPGVPWFRDASPELIDGLQDIGIIWGGTDLSAILAEARPRDTLTLWHLLPDLPPNQRGEVFDAIAALAPDKLPENVTREKVSGLDKAALSSWQEALVPLWGDGAP